MKKVLIFFTLFFTVIIFNPVLANNQDNVIADKNEVLRLKNIFNITKDFEQFSISTYTENKNKILNYHWSNENDQSISISTDTFGNILTYQNYHDNPNFATIKSKDEIQDLIQSYLNKIDNNLLNEYVLKDFDINIKDNYARFRYERKINDIFVLNDYFTITIELSQGNLLNFSKNITKYISEKDFPSKENIISLDDAKEILKKEQPYYLGYFIKDDKDKKVLEIYSQLKENQAIDAKTSKLLESINSEMPIYNESAKESSMDFDESLSPVEKDELNKIKNLKSISEYKKYINKNFNTKNLKFSDYSLSKRDNDYIYNITYIDKDSVPQIEFSFNAKELELLSFNKFIESQDNTNLKEDEAINISKDFIKKHLKQEYSVDFKNIEIDSNKNTTSLKFYRIENDHYVFNNFISLTISNKDKEVIYYNMNFNNLDFNNIQDFKSIDKAYNKILDNKYFDLFYIYYNDKPKLVYTFKASSPRLLAKSLDEIDNSANIIKNEEIIYNTSNSPYKEEIEYLKDLKIGVPNIENLQSKIKEKDLVYLIYSTISPIPYNNESIENIYKYPKPLEISKNDYTTKDNNAKNNLAIKLIVNANGYSNLSNLKDIFKKDIFKDENTLSQIDRVYYSFAYGLDLYTEEKANSSKEITHEDALHLVYNFLK